MNRRWTQQEIWDWYNARPWVMGVNYCCSVCAGSELWQDDLHDEVMQTVRRELDLMQEIGINGVRIFLPMNFWYHQRERFFDKLDALLGELDARGMTLMPVIFDDCIGFNKPETLTPPLPTGWRPYVIGHHSGQKANPFTGEKNKMGYCPWDDEENRPVLREYLTALITRFGKDERIYAWDLWNEPGNTNRDDTSIPYLEEAFALARSLDPVQPLTAGVWRYYKNPDEPLEKIALKVVELSDIITFHMYGRFEKVKMVVDHMAQFGRPMMNTEWLNRVLDNMMQDNLPLYHDKRIGSYSWGLVAGKMQHYLPWDNLYIDDPSLPLRRWQHDLFDVYHTPYDPEEIELMKKLSPRNA